MGSTQAPASPASTLEAESGIAPALASQPATTLLDGSLSPAHASHGRDGLAPSSPGVRQAPSGGQPTDAASPPASPPAPVVKVQLEVIAKTVDVLGVPTEVWTYGGTIPGTIIRVSEGTRVEVTLVNGHSQTHSLHTHFRGNLLGSDGSSDTAPLPVVPHQHNPYPVSQNPIGPYDPRTDRDVADPGQSYTYTFFADTPGNFLYHCHVFLATDHIERGLFGMFVVYPKGWSWTEMPLDPLNGNTKARVTDDQGRSYFEDVVMMSELSPVASPASPPAAPAGAPITSEYPTSVPTSGFTPAAAGKIHLANYRAWNDPYVVGPVRPNERVIIRVANIGDEMHDWHVHSHWFDVIDKTSRDWNPMQTDDTWLLGPGDTIMTELTAGNPGYWFMHDHIVPEAYTGMVPWLWVDGEPLPNSAPTVDVASILDGAMVGGRVLLAGSATDFEGRETVRSVEVAVDGGAWQPAQGLLSWRYAWDTRDLPDGEHKLAFRASDGNSYSTLEPMTVTVRNALSSPGAGDPLATNAAHKESLPGFGLAALAAVVVGLVALRRR